MKKIARWAYHRPFTARWTMAIIKVVLLLLTWQIAMLLQQLDIFISPDSIYIAGVIAVLGMYFYPDAKKKNIYFETVYYYRQKICYGIVTFSSFFIFLVAFNSGLPGQGVYGARAIYYPHTTHEVTISGDPEKKTAKQKKSSRKAFRKQWKALQEGEKSRSGLVAELVLAIVLGAALGVILVWIACSIACAGSELLALLVLVSGAGAITWGLIAWIRSIRRRKRLRKQAMAAGV